jgi:hypothetical protein
MPIRVRRQGKWAPEQTEAANEHVCRPTECSVEIDSVAVVPAECDCLLCRCSCSDADTLRSIRGVVRTDSDREPPYSPTAAALPPLATRTLHTIFAAQPTRQL